MRYIYLFIILLFISVNAYAQDSADFSMGGRGGVTVLNQQAGPGLSFDWHVAYKKILFSNSLADLSLIPTGPGDRYKNVTTSDSRSVCRDTNTGETVNNQKCASNLVTYYGFSFDVSYSLSDIANPVYAGMGYRLSSEHTFYGQVKIYFSHLLNKRNGFLKIAAGRDYIDVGVGITLSPE